jgi:diaminopimelate decarboxylase
MRDGELFCEEVPLARIAEEVGTPTYVYSSATLSRHYRVFDEALSCVPHRICYSVKACSNLSILRLLANLGAGFDIVSGGELYRLQAAGIPTESVVFSGVGKTRAEMKAALSAGIATFNVESLEELALLSEVAVEAGVVAPVSIRVNPDVDAQTHPYISTGLKGNKFGVEWALARESYAKAAALPGLRVVGVDCHIGSQLLRLDPLLEALDRMLELVEQLRADGHTIQHLDMGGGLGIRYKDETPPSPNAFAQAFAERVQGRDVELVFEPGRVLVGNAGILLTRVLYRKGLSAKRFLIVDAAMNDALRPSLYDAYHEIRPVREAAEGTLSEVVDVVGPICESGDFLARSREMPRVVSGDLLAMMSAGAYGFSMASNYNSRPRVAEVLVHGDQYDVIRRRESVADLVCGEELAGWLLSS